MDSIDTLRSHFRSILDAMGDDVGDVKLALELELNWDRLPYAQRKHRDDLSKMTVEEYALPDEIPFHGLYEALDDMLG